MPPYNHRFAFTILPNSQKKKKKKSNYITPPLNIYNCSYNINFEVIFTHKKLNFYSNNFKLNISPC